MEGGGSVLLFGCEGAKLCGRDDRSSTNAG